MLEGVGCAGVYLAVPGTLSLFATGRTSGVVLDIGYQQTTVIPVFQVSPWDAMFGAGSRTHMYAVTRFPRHNQSISLPTRESTCQCGFLFD